MQLKHLTLSALVAAATAQQQTTTGSSSSASAVSSVAPSGSLNTVSVLAILATAVPTSLVNLYFTNSASAENLVASQLSAGSTPAWFQSLPSPVQTYLLGGAGANLTSPRGNSTMGMNSTTVVGGTTRTTGGRTTVVGGTTRTGGAGSTRSPQATQGGGSGGQSSSSTGGASLPTAIVGAGLAGAVGLVGLFAL